MKLLLNRQGVYCMSRFNGRLLSLSSNHYRDFTSVTASASGPIYSASFYDPNAQQNPKFSKYNYSSRRYLYSSQHATVTESRLEPISNSSDSVEEDDATNEFLSRFVRSMRGKLTEVYTDFDKKTIDSMLIIIAAKVASALEKDSLEEMLEASIANPSDDFSADLWKTVLEVSGSVVDDMEKESKKEKMKKFLQSEEVKEMCRFAGEIGIRGDMLRELRFKWAREKMEDSEFYENLKQLEEDNSDETVDTNVETFGELAITKEEEEKAKSILKRHGKIKYKIYGLDLSNSKWAEVADKIHEANEIIWPQEAKPMEGKAKIVTEKILSLKEEDDFSQLLLEWAELLQPSRIDWMNLLDKLNERNRELFYKMSEHLLSEKPFQPSIGNYFTLVGAYAKENRLEDAERILKKMNEDSIAPDLSTSTTLVQMYLRAGNIQRAREAFDTMKSNGSRPDFKTYNSMIMAYVNSGETKLAEALVREMEARDVKPTEEIYMALLRGFSKCGDAKGAERIVITMTFAGLPHGQESYSYLVEAHGRDDNPDRARFNFDLVTTIGKPNDKTIASMIAAYEKKNMLDKALELLVKLEKDGIEPGPATYTVMLDWFGKLKLVDEAEEILGKIAQQGEAPPLEIQVSLFHMYASTGNEKKALQALGVLESKKELLKFNDFERVINGLLAGGFAQDAKRVQELMVAQGFTPSEKLQMSLKTEQMFGQRPKNG